MNKALVGIIGALVIGALGITFFVKNKNIAALPSPSPVKSIDAPFVDSLKQGGSSYSDPNGIYVFLYPSDYKLDTQNDGQITRIYKTGPTQKGQTEIYDGVIMTFEGRSKSGKSLEDWTEEYIKSMTNDQTIELVKPKEKTEVNGFPAYSFVIRGLGEHQYYTVEKNDDSEFVTVIANNVSDPGNLGFQNEVNSILATLDLLK